MSDVRQWLETLGLGQYGDAFEQNAIEWAHLPDLDQDALKELGVRAMGHRMTLLNAIGSRQVPDEFPVAAGSPAAPLSPTGNAERRQLTVMFCDLVGSTSLSASMDPEVYRELLTTYQDAARAAIAPFEGYIARYMGDGLLVYFGYPVARENDPERAARAGLAIVEGVTALESTAPLQVRVGIATGPVVVGDIIGEGASEEAAVLGETPNLAARLQGAAAPNTVLLSPATQELLRGRVETEALESVGLKGLSLPIVPYRAVRPRSLLEVSESRLDSSPLVGRDVEVALLERAWQHAQSSKGQAVLLSGEPGVGKSRLLRAFQEGVEEASRTRVQWYCSPYYQMTANYPAIDQLKRSLSGDSMEALETLVRDLGLDNDVTVPPLALLLSIPLSDRFAAPDWSPDELKRRLIQAQIELLLAAAKGAPVLFVIEDLHWADPTTLEVLGEMMAAIRDQRVFMLMTARLEFSPPWNDQSYATTQWLGPLSRNETMQLVQDIVESHGLSPDVIEQIVKRTDGIPLFVEELIKSLLEAGGDARVPASLQDSMMARLDRLGATKKLAQTASVIGRVFSVDGLIPLADRPREVVEQGLDQLVESGLVYRRKAGEFEFKHALVRDTAYEGLLRAERRSLHAKVLEYLETESQDQIESQLSLRAYHSHAAERWTLAFDYSCRAGKHAMTRGANAEALAMFDDALDASSHLEIDDALARRLIAMRCDLRTPLHALGQTERELIELDKALTLAKAHNDYWHTTMLQTYVCNIYRKQVRSEEALRVAEQARDGARKAEDRSLEICTAFELAHAYLLSGRLREAIDTAMSGVELIRPDEVREAFGRPAPSSVLLRELGAKVQAYIGDHKNAATNAQTAVAIADSVGVPFGQVGARWSLALTAYWQGKFVEAEAALVALLKIAKAEGIRFSWVMGGTLLAEIQARTGRGDNALSLAQEIAEGYGRLDYQLNSTLNNAVLGLAQWVTGNVEEAQRSVQKSLESRMDSTVNLAWSEWIGSQVLGDPALACTTLRSAQNASDRLGMLPLAALCRMQQARGEGGNSVAIEAAKQQLIKQGMSGWARWYEDAAPSGKIEML